MEPWPSLLSKPKALFFAYPRSSIIHTCPQVPPWTPFRTSCANLGLPSVCDSTHGILRTSPPPSAPPEHHSFRHRRLVVQRLGRRLLSIRYAAPQAASS